MAAGRPRARVEALARLRAAALVGLCVVACGPSADDVGRTARDAETPPEGADAVRSEVPDDPDSTVVRAAFETSKGRFVIAVRPAWAPRGAERFLHLVRTGYYDDARFHRVVEGFIAQWGLAGDPARTAEWLNAFIPDDPPRASNTRGRVAFAFTEPGTRSTQVFINLADNARLDSAGFAPFGEVVEGWDVVTSLHAGYGEASGGGLRRGDQRRIVSEGNLHLDREFPLLDRIIRARVEPRH